VVGLDVLCDGEGKREGDGRWRRDSGRGRVHQAEELKG
jgi:hypothetical protein